MSHHAPAFPRGALTRGPYPGRRDRAEPLARPSRGRVIGGVIAMEPTQSRSGVLGRARAGAGNPADGEAAKRPLITDHVISRRAAIGGGLAGLGGLLLFPGLSLARAAVPSDPFVIVLKGLYQPVVHGRDLGLSTVDPGSSRSWRRPGSIDRSLVATTRWSTRCTSWHLAASTKWPASAISAVHRHRICRATAQPIARQSPTGSESPDGVSSRRGPRAAKSPRGARHSAGASDRRSRSSQDPGIARFSPRTLPEGPVLCAH
jgi:hypothetical protein